MFGAQVICPQCGASDALSCTCHHNDENENEMGVDHNNFGFGNSNFGSGFDDFQNDKEEDPEYEFLRRQIWHEKRMTCGDIFIKCNVCGELSSQWCECKYKKFKPTNEEIKKHKDKQEAAEYESIRRQIWDKKKMTDFGVCAICDTCGGGSMSWCECEYEKFKPSDEEIKKHKEKNKLKSSNGYPPIERLFKTPNDKIHEQTHESVKEKMWNEKWKGKQIVYDKCSVCGGVSKLCCDCRKAEFNPSMDEINAFLDKLTK